MTEEQPLDPELPIIDPHLHHWEILLKQGSLLEAQTFLLPEARAMVRLSGHNITHTVFIDSHAMYRAAGPAEWRSLGETEFATGLAAMCASGNYGPTQFAHRIVGNIDLCLGDAVEPILAAHIAAAGGRFVGARHRVSFSAAGLFGAPCDPATRALLRKQQFRAGAQVLGRAGLSLDLWCLHTQLGELAEFADTAPDLIIVLDHLGTPERHGLWEGRTEVARADWARGIAELAKRQNVRIKLGGLGMDISRGVAKEPGNAMSQDLADKWRPYIETCITAFGTQRCMFESNFPPDQAAATYGAIWNAFKRITQQYSNEEKDWLFRRTAAETYRV